MRTTLAPDDIFFNSLLKEDQLGVVIRAHIQIEARLNLFLEAHTSHPNQLPRLRFEQLAKLAVALGLDDKTLPALLEFGNLRNAFAHRLDATLTDEMVNKLLQKLTPEDQHTIREAYEKTQVNFVNEGMPSFDCADARHKFITIAYFFDRFLFLAEKEEHMARLVDANYPNTLNNVLSEWNSAEDDEAYRNL